MSNRWAGNSTSSNDSCRGRTNPTIVADGNNIYAAGGLGAVIDNKLNFLKVNCKYNTVTRSWARLADMPEGRVGTAVAKVKDKILVAGGFNNVLKAPENGSVDAYDTTKDIWDFLLPDGSSLDRLTAQAGEGELLARAFMSYAQAGRTLYLGK
jgi:hypothetical protein